MPALPTSGPESAQHDVNNDALMIDASVLAAARRLIVPGQRRMLGIVGAPASGKSTLTEALVAQLGSAVQSVPMDGFHLSQRQLERLGRSERKGAPDTFDAYGYRDLLARIRACFGAGETAGEVVYAPGFYRDIEEPVAASLAIKGDTPLVITEGNYLLLDDAPWPGVAALLDDIWFLDVETGQREQWLAARHQRFGRSRAAAWAWIESTDRPNAQQIIASAHKAYRRLCWDGSCVRFCD